jgi:hypothetical protein
VSICGYILFAREFMVPATASPENDLIAVAQVASVDLDTMVADVDRALAEPLYWFPVRHHSPAIARQLARCIRERNPKIIFIEGPFEAQHLIEFIVDAKTKPPVAIYSSFRDESSAPATPGGQPPQPPRHSAWYPLVSYSPEYVAMSLAKEIGAEAIFIDLPHYASLGRAKPSRRRDLADIAPRSRFFQKLTEAAGHRTFSETWDALFEACRPEQTYEQLRRDVAIFCAAVRQTTSAGSLAEDETLSRERFMMQTIRNTLAAKEVQPQDAMVVCGGFHIFLNRDDPNPPPPIPTAGTLSVTVAPYSYFRLSELAGYGAGNRAPRYYELCFEHHSAVGDHDQVVIDHVIDILKEARKRGEPLSSADAIGVTQATTILARLPAGARRCSMISTMP